MRSIIDIVHVPNGFLICVPVYLDLEISRSSLRPGERTLAGHKALARSDAERCVSYNPPQELIEAILRMDLGLLFKVCCAPT